MPLTSNASSLMRGAGGVRRHGISVRSSFVKILSYCSLSASAFSLPVVIYYVTFGNLYYCLPMQSISLVAHVAKLGFKRLWYTLKDGLSRILYSPSLIARL